MAGTQGHMGQWPGMRAGREAEAGPPVPQEPQEEVRLDPEPQRATSRVSRGRITQKDLHFVRPTQAAARRA